MGHQHNIVVLALRLAGPTISGLGEKIRILNGESCPVGEQSGIKKVESKMASKLSNYYKTLWF